MRFDMHCHTKEGSLDGKLTLAEYVSLLKEKGYQGMLITDHNSYDAYRYYRKYKADPVFQDFVVLKGIEYDTIDAGHILVIMPPSVKLPLLELRGLSVSALIEIVHFFGGILGPAHPCGEKYLSLCNTRRYRKNPHILKKFDFMETYNACEPPEVNEAAAKLAGHYGLAGFGGSDAHKEDCVGLGYTDLPDTIQNEADLIDYIRSGRPAGSGGEHYRYTTRERIGAFNNILLYSFWVFNKGAGLLRLRKRRHEVKDYKKSLQNTAS